MPVSEGRHVRQNQQNLSTTLTDELYVAIRNAILSWKYSPNDILVESRLAKQYEVSKTPVREALALLSQEGWVEVLPRVGYRVTPIRVTDVEELFEMRLMAEREAIRLAIQRASDEDLEGLLDGLNVCASQDEASLTYPETFIDGKDPIHMKLASLAQNSRLQRLIYRLLRDWTRMCLSSPDVREKAYAGEAENCLRICEALMRRDATCACSLMHEHIMYSKKLILSQMSLSSI